LPSTRRPHGEYGVGERLDAGLVQLGLGLVAVGLEHVDAQVQRRAGGHGRHELPEALVVEVVLQRAGQPVGHVVAQLLGERVAVDRAHAVEPLLLVLAHAAADQRLVALPGQDRQAALERAAAALGQVLEQQALAQHGVGRLGQRVALARAQFAVLAEEVRDDDVRRHVELADLAQQFGGDVEEGVRMHGGVFRGYR
jgi:hypothetical protein